MISSQDEQTYWDDLRRRRRPAGSHATPLELLQGHPQWACLRDEAGRTPAMWAVAAHPEIWTALRPALLRPMVAAQTSDGFSLWFHAGLNTVPLTTQERLAPLQKARRLGARATTATIQMEEPSRLRHAKEMADWLRGVLPDVRQGNGAGLFPALCSDAGVHEVQAVRGTQERYSGVLDPSWTKALGERFGADALWTASWEVETEAARRVWRGVLRSLQALPGSRMRPNEDAEDAERCLDLAACRWCAGAAEAVLVGRPLPAMQAPWRAAVGAALMLHATPSVKPAVAALVRRLWDGADWPGPERLETVGPPVAWMEELAAACAATELHHALPDARAAPRGLRL